jgi:hypothetical protein
MSSATQAMDDEGLLAAAQALTEQLKVEAQGQGGYLRCFADGNVSLELEWVSPASLAEAAVRAYLAAVSRKQSRTQAGRE